MTRTQISLETEHYLFVKGEAARRGVSFSAVIRDLVQKQMESANAANHPHVWDLAGLIVDSPFAGQDHDDVLYGADT